MAEHTQKVWLQRNQRRLAGGAPPGL